MGNELQVVRQGSTFSVMSPDRADSWKIVARIDEQDDERAMAELLRGLSAELAALDPSCDEKTLAVGSWDVVVRREAEDQFELFEWSPDRSGLVPGISATLRYMSEQRASCEAQGVEPAFPRPLQMVAVSDGVLDGRRPVDGVRYEAPGHMSGWYITTDEYSGDIRDLRVEHLYHVGARRPELARYLALPPGYRFRWGDEAECVNDSETPWSRVY